MYYILFIFSVSVLYCIYIFSVLYYIVFIFLSVCIIFNLYFIFFYIIFIFYILYFILYIVCIILYLYFQCLYFIIFIYFDHFQVDLYSMKSLCCLLLLSISELVLSNEELCRYAYQYNIEKLRVLCDEIAGCK